MEYTVEVLSLYSILVTIIVTCINVKHSVFCARCVCWVHMIVKINIDYFPKNMDFLFSVVMICCT